MHIFILEYQDGKIYKSVLPKKYEHKPEKFLIKKGFHLDNIYYMVTENAKIINL